MEEEQIIIGIIGEKDGNTILLIPSNILGFSLEKGEAAIVFIMWKNSTIVDAECEVTGKTSLIIRESETGKTQKINLLQHIELKYTHYCLQRIADDKTTFGKDEKFVPKPLS